MTHEAHELRLCFIRRLLACYSNGSLSSLQQSLAVCIKHTLELSTSILSLNIEERMTRLRGGAFDRTKEKAH